MIQLFQSSHELRDFIDLAKRENKTIGFVPTMGALHEGHCTLAAQAAYENDISIVSIFVNPTQFNDKYDLEKYKRDLVSDTQKLANTGISAIFAPSVEDIYPLGMSYGDDIDLGGLDAFMEGPSRPGHFRGMAQVVKRLLDLVTPDRLYMGQKDFQQFTIVGYFIHHLKIKTQLVVCPIVREENGLAMSSRNERLSPDVRNKAGVIFKTLTLLKRYKYTKSVDNLITYADERINAVSPFEVEYISIIDGYTLKPVANIRHHPYVVVCTVVKAEGVRLLDNIILKHSKSRKR